MEDGVAKAMDYLMRASVDKVFVGQLNSAIECLQLFVQHNWTGPLTLTDQSVLELLRITHQEYTERDAKAREWLNVDGEFMYEKVKFPLLLALAKLHLQNGPSEMCDTRKWLVWRMRSVHVHQCFIESRCSSLRDEAMSAIDKLQALVDGSKDASLACWTLEASRVAKFYYEHKLSQTLLDDFTQYTGLCVQFDGVPGKRTKYQGNDIAQLVLKVTRDPGHPQSIKSTGGDVDTPPPTKLPAVSRLQDDTLLEKIEYATNGEKPADNVVEEVTALEQCLILTLCENQKYVKGEDGIVKEETQAFVNYVLDRPLDWSVQTNALYQRCLGERTSTRLLERTLHQLNELLDQQNANKPSPEERLRLVYTSGTPPHWVIQRSLGELYQYLGAFASAMEVFERTSLWDPLIVCCQRADRSARAEELIRSRLDLGPTPSLYCSLADVTGDISHYTTAWESSGRRSARAMRGLAYHHLRSNEFPQAVECFDRTLEINPLQLPCWFSCGCAALADQQFNKAASAFRRCLMLEEDNFEAWNNLAAAYARSDQKPRAFAVLQDAVKCSYDNWRIWENYVLFGMECGELEKVVQGIHRLLDIRGNEWCDEQLLEILSKAICSLGVTHRLVTKSRELYGRITATITNNSSIWCSYARLILLGITTEQSGETTSEQSGDANTDVASTDIQRGIQCLQKGYRCAITPPNWHKDIKSSVHNSELLLDLCGWYQKYSSPQLMSTGRLQLKSHIARLKVAHLDPVTKQVHEEIEPVLIKLETKLEAFVN